MKILRSALLLFAVLIASVWTATAALAQTPSPDVDAQTVPAANQVLSAAPTQIEVTPPAGATSGTAKVLDSNGKTVAHGALVDSGQGPLSLHLPSLGQGTYLVTWSAGQSTGSFGFDVNAAAASPSLVTQPKTPASLGPLQDNLVQWAPLILMMIFVGTLGLEFLVTGPGRPADQLDRDRGQGGTSLAADRRRRHHLDGADHSGLVRLHRPRRHLGLGRHLAVAGRRRRGATSSVGASP